MPKTADLEIIKLLEAIRDSGGGLAGPVLNGISEINSPNNVDLHIDSGTGQLFLTGTDVTIGARGTSGWNGIDAWFFANHCYFGASYELKDTVGPAPSNVLIWQFRPSGASADTLMTSDSGPTLELNRLRGTVHFPTPVQKDDELGSVLWSGTDASSNDNTQRGSGARIIALCAEDAGFTADNHGTTLKLQTCAIGAKVLTDRIVIDGNGNVLLPGLSTNGLVQTSGGGGQLGVSNALLEAAMTTKASDANAMLPVILYVNNVAALKSGSAGTREIASIAVPLGISRYRIMASASTASPHGTVLESGGPFTASTTFSAWDDAGTPVQLTAAVAAANIVGNFAPAQCFSNTLSFSSRPNIIIKQTEPAPNGNLVDGTISFYILIQPIPAS